MDSLQTEKLNIATKTKLGVAQVKNTATINTLDNVKIAKVLTACAKAKVESIVPGNAQVKFEGFVEYDLLVVLENANIVPLTQKSSFSQVFENSSISPESILTILPCVMELTSISTGTEDITYTSLINFDIYSLNQNSNIICAQPIEGVFVKEGEVSFNSLAANIAYDFNVNFEEKKDAKINKILFINSSSTIKSIIPSTGYFVVSGEVYTCVTYQFEDGLIKSFNNVTSFSEEIENANVTKESIIQACIFAKETIVTENTEKSTFTFDIPLQILAHIFNKNTLNCVVDAYSIKNEINLTTASFEQDEFFATKQMEENIITNFVLPENTPLVDKVLAVTPIGIALVNQIIKEGEILLEGIANVNVIYYFEDEEGNNTLNSIDIEVPFSLTIPVAELKENDKVCINLVLGDINVKSKRGKELEILAEVKINCNIVRPEISAITSQITIGEEKAQKDFALEIYLAKANQTLWDIAKELNVSTTDIVNQNSDLTLPLKDGDKVVAYNQRIVDFD